MGPLIDRNELKEVIKTALIEVFEERKDLLQEAIEDALEDSALGRAIEEGIKEGFVPRKEVMDFLEGKK